ncbi:YbaB/EbfC family nucleoid-associated protein [Aestuariimicrobium ganziense]|uniref:YbaB/EbfC family nucleoid-associated protein n=1 Tax=Aestuariimicrobium ganziense TaxID=2773677 RepID=UPI0019450BC8|nr:YbaB/EbfC family nucleoid-associated protein [Aestuariimicrobium ganziense]
MFPEGMDMSGLLAQAQAMQAQLRQTQQELANSTFTGSAGGDLVEATVRGTGELIGLTIKPEACDPDDTETLADLVIAAVRDATTQAQDRATAAMPAMPDLGQLGL